MRMRRVFYRIRDVLMADFGETIHRFNFNVPIKSQNLQRNCSLIGISCRCVSRKLSVTNEFWQQKRGQIPRQGRTRSWARSRESGRPCAGGCQLMLDVFARHHGQPVDLAADWDAAKRISQRAKMPLAQLEFCHFKPLTLLDMSPLCHRPLFKSFGAKACSSPECRPHDVLR